MAEPTKPLAPVTSRRSSPPLSDPAIAHRAVRVRSSYRDCHTARRAAASVAFPTFVSFRSTRFYERRKQRNTSNFMILVRHLDLKFLNELAAIMIGTSNPPH